MSFVLPLSTKAESGTIDLGVRKSTLSTERSSDRIPADRYYGRAQSGSFAWRRDDFRER